ncbi:MAG TPA: hypothetical protein VFG56_00215 [Candidatus Saccharimonadales bacterium]|nr:hypothetical protein [Candidatus Saccharimonadales bacterium]
MTEQAPRQRLYEGPPKKINDVPRREEEIRSRSGMPGGRSYSDHLTDQYGQEGRGWEFATDQYDAENKMDSVEAETQHALAREALGNRALTGHQETDDGVRLSNRQIEEYTRTAHPPKGDILVYPDGDVHQADKLNDAASEEAKGE